MKCSKSTYLEESSVQHLRPGQWFGALGAHFFYRHERPLSFCLNTSLARSAEKCIRFSRRLHHTARAARFSFSALLATAGRRTAYIYISINERSEMRN
jgi:hypothetical protein